MSSIRVVVLLVAPVVAYDASIPAQVLAHANSVADAPLFDVALASADGDPVATTHGYALHPHGDGRLVEDADLVIVPGTRNAEPMHLGRLPDGVGRVLDRRTESSRIASICTGAFVLGAAGLLDERPATTHWAYTDAFELLYPRVRLDPRALYVDDGDVLTSAGLSAGVDLCLHLVREVAGADVANQVARHMVVPAWRDGGQAQFVEIAPPPVAEDSTGAARAWAFDRLDRPLTLAQLARAAMMSTRTFNRRFRVETGMTPGAWLRHQRVSHARALLETTDLGVDAIAARAGFGTGTSLRTHFRHVVGVTPSAYRAAFRRR